jgi:hypothetical protein
MSITSPYVVDSAATEVVTPQTLTFDHIKRWNPETMKKYMQLPEMREAIYETVRKQSQEAVEAAQAQIDQNQQLVVAAEQVDAAPVAPVVPEAPVVVAPEVVIPAPVKKVVVEYQIKDEDGNPIGRPTHLEASSDEEMRQKMIEAHTQATRAFHRLKKQKVQSLREVNNQPVPTPVVQTMTDAELLAAVKELKSDDPKIALEAHRKLNKAELDRVQAEADAKVSAANELRRQEAVSYSFLKAHQHDFNNCDANVTLIKDYFEDNKLPWTLDNLEIAYHALENELAPVAAPVVSVPPANPVTVTATVSATPAVTAPAQSVAAAPVTTVPPANPVPAQPRPGVNGGIVPGQNSAPRPAVAAKGLTMDEINSWDGPTMRAKMRNPQIRAEIDRVVAEAKIRRGR